MRGSLVTNSWMALALLLACTPPVEEGTSSASEASESGSEGTDSDATPTSDGLACVPGKVEVCPCAGGGQGVQTCDPDGQSYGPCDCPDPTGMSGDATSSGDSDETTSGGGTSSGETGADATSGETGTDGTTGDPPVECEDPDDAPNAEADALVIEDQDCFGQPKLFSGVLAGATDSDWFTYHGECFQQPEVLHELDAAGDVRLCVFIDCDMGTPEFECTDGAQMNVSPGGLIGCCGGAGISFDLNCAGGGENAKVLVRLDQLGMGEAEACIDYTVEYSYNDGF